MAKFKVGDKVKVVRNNGDDFDGIKIGDTGEVVEICTGKYPIYLKINNHDQYAFKEDELELYNEYFVGEDKMEKTFKEVIADIKEGEVWEVDQFEIKRYKTGTIVIRSTSTGKIFGFEEKDRFKLKRKEYTFEEAFKAYEEGKEIESIYTGTKFCDDKYLKNDVYSDWKLGVTFRPEEIKKKWHIND